MTYYLIRFYFKHSFFMSCLITFFTSHNKVEKNLVPILLAIHYRLAFNKVPNRNDENLRSSCKYLKISFDNFMRCLKENDIFNGYINNKLNLIMSHWFYGRSAYRK